MDAEDQTTRQPPNARDGEVAASFFLAGIGGGSGKGTAEIANGGFAPGRGARGGIDSPTRCVWGEGSATEQAAALPPRTGKRLPGEPLSCRIGLGYRASCKKGTGVIIGGQASRTEPPSLRAPSVRRGQTRRSSSSDPIAPHRCRRNLLLPIESASSASTAPRWTRCRPAAERWPPPLVSRPKRAGFTTSTCWRTNFPKIWQRLPDKERANGFPFRLASSASGRHTRPPAFLWRVDPC